MSDWHVDGWHVWSTAFLVAEWVIRLVMLAYVPYRRSPNAARAWLLLIFLEPVVGVVLYAIFGRAYLPKWRIERQRRSSAYLRARRDAAPPGLLAAGPTLEPRFQQAVQLAEKLADFPMVPGNALELIDDYQGAIDRLVADIDGASLHVHLLYYIFEPDRTGRQVADAVIRAARRGVRCRVMMDASGSKPGLRVLAPGMRAQGVEVLAALPRRRGARFDLRNHRKIAVVDGRMAYIGSQNVVDAYGYKGRKITYEELVVRASGPVVRQLQAVFLLDRYLETGEELAEEGLFPQPVAAGAAAAQSLPSGPTYPVENGQRLMVALVHAARERVVLTTPYFVPDEPFQQAVQSAALRGVEVHLVVPRAVDQPLVRLAQEAHYEPLLESGVRIHRYRTRFLHAKHLSFDGAAAIIGSSNIDIRSFALNEEISLLVYDPEVVARLRVVQERYLAESDPLTLEEWRRRPLVRKLAESLALMVDALF